MIHIFFLTLLITYCTSQSIGVNSLQGGDGVSCSQRRRGERGEELQRHHGRQHEWKEHVPQAGRADTGLRMMIAHTKTEKVVFLCTRC